MTKKESLQLSILGLVLVSVAFSALGSLVSVLERLSEKSGCVYKSYATKYNPPYRLGCELFRDRTFTNGDIKEK